MPKLYGNLPAKNEIFYLAADETYFNSYEKTCIVSIKYNFDIPIHIHLYNPSQETKNWCDTKKVSYSYEIFDEDLTIVYSDRILAGWNSEIFMNKYKVPKKNCVALDSGLNSEWNLEIRDFEFYIYKILNRIEN